VTVRADLPPSLLPTLPGVGAFINLVPDHVIFHRMYPAAVDRKVVECDWLYLSDVVERSARRSPDT
jgi:hypothetical protein